MVIVGHNLSPFLGSYQNDRKRNLLAKKAHAIKLLHKPREFGNFWVFKTFTSIKLWHSRVVESSILSSAYPNCLFKNITASPSSPHLFWFKRGAGWGISYFKLYRWFWKESQDWNTVVHTSQRLSPCVWRLGRRWHGGNELHNRYGGTGFGVGTQQFVDCGQVTRNSLSLHESLVKRANLRSRCKQQLFIKARGKL